ncbi:amidohydrolase [Mucilaginibacter sp. UR6-11]|uniref:amidohydrolase family protein n=1 Tax=Mucilaginibacter sp. UR6-11 TaxID=1435644 RepID=UPI001E50B2EC|nr:amidohydrolase family protein [Mucilaginibacter sp. UR6-11]MCC8423714.1 amidohydrolase family protein [Mucilaginibacter sp. UR6-11]
MQRIDSHQHFWNYDPVKYSWINEDMEIIRKNFLPSDLEPILKEYGFNGCVSVQADQTEEENKILLDHAAKHDFIKGVVGWVDLKAANVAERLAYYQQFKKLKGFRHVLQGEPDRAYMLNADFKRGISKLKQFGYTYDILIYTDQLAYAAEFAAAFPDQPFVIDHLAKPEIKDGGITKWAIDMKAIAQNKNVSCKLSGMVTEADWRAWKPEDFTPYIDVVFEAFGAGRVMYGSDWPVCRVAATYQQTLEIAEAYVDKLSVTEQEKFWSGNAIEFYGL